MKVKSLLKVGLVRGDTQWLCKHLRAAVLRFVCVRDTLIAWFNFC